MPAATANIFQILIGIAAVAGIVAGVVKMLAVRVVAAMDRRLDAIEAGQVRTQTMIEAEMAELRSHQSETEKEAMQRDASLQTALDSLKTTMFSDFVQKSDLKTTLDSIERKLDRIEDRMDRYSERVIV